MKKYILYFLFTLAYIISNLAIADEINISSNELHIDRNEKVSVFTGNVYAWNDNFKIWSEKLIIEFKENQKEIKIIIAEEKVKIIKDDMNIKGDKAVYYPSLDKLNTSGNVEIDSNGNLINCDEITLDLENSISIMKSNTSKRVEAMVQIEGSL